MKNIITALATPFKNGDMDLHSYIKLVEYQRFNGVDGLLALGTTAESQLLTDVERKLLVTAAKDTAKNIPVIAGVHETATYLATEEAKRLQDIGADALLVAPPVFCKCTPDGFCLHIEAICDSVNIPVILYNVPSRAGYCLNAEAIIKLKDKISAIKDACNDTAFAEQIVQHTPVLCGNDEKLSQYVLAGACGVISVTSNIAPQWTKKILNGVISDEFEEFARLTMQEINPIAIKYALYKCKIFDTYEMRLPLTQANETTRRNIDEFLRKYGDKIR